MIGALASLPRRLAARQVERIGGRLRRGVGRDTKRAVVGRQMLARYDRAEIERRITEARRPSLHLMSENAFLRILVDEVKTVEPGTIDRSTLIEQSKLAGSDLDLLLLFDTFVADKAPFALRDLILAKKYAALIADGADWYGIARAVHRGRSAGDLTALPLETRGRDRIYALFEDRLGELDGQFLLPVGETANAEDEALFALAEDAEAEGRFEEAARAYARCLTVDPGDAVAAFNRANCLRALGELKEAQKDYWRAIQIDPRFVDAWFNLACLFKDRENYEAAKQHFEKAIALDRGYRDAIYNLAALAFDQGDLDTAQAQWERYLVLDRDSEWARNAERGLQFIKQQRQKAG
ncbi:tetratricopeptide repeat protein [Nitratireductor sp. XY-223]|uniref:tetratricopeptide repeat protein n=1 Tax=Nitratireductor sp. XY-223 TaxID=2561926 RepID=UPI0010AA7394|nr:tetratricopeptide repeat protein [Nitratireductor sp. XY-223]